MVGRAPFSIQATRYHNADYDHAPTKSQRHSVDLIPSECINVRINALQRGVGGNDSWGAEPLDAYRIMLPNTFHFELAFSVVRARRIATLSRRAHQIKRYIKRYVQRDVTSQ